jgi:hypothetical protein
LAEASRRRAVFTAPAATTTISPVQVSSPASLSVTTPVTVRPFGSVSSRTAFLPVRRVTFG